jgi:hypothetical protein
MLRIAMEAEMYTLNRTDFELAVGEFMNITMRRAVQEFLKACVARIPVRTGFARGSFGNLTREFGVEDQVTGNSQREYYYHSRGQGVLKTPTSGRQFVTDPSNVLTKTGSGVTFNLDNAIKYYPFIANGGTEQGIAAMNAYLRQAINNFFPIQSLLTKTTIRVSSTGNQSSTVERPNMDAVLSQRELMTRGF